MNKRKTGNDYEEMVAGVLIKHGYQILEKNFRNRMGEIDLIGIDGQYLVFIEVKYRNNTQVGAPEDAVTRKKQQVISRVADYYLMKHPELTNLQIRFDVAAIVGTHLKVYKHAFEYQWR